MFVVEKIVLKENLDLHNIITPVNAIRFEQLLVQSNYDTKETQYLINGFKHGFSLQFEGDRKVKKLAPNLKLRIGSHVELWNKVMNEVEKGRYAGPSKNLHLSILYNHLLVWYLKTKEQKQDLFSTFLIPDQEVLLIQRFQKRFVLLSTQPSMKRLNFV